MCVDDVMKFHAKPRTLLECTHKYRKRPTKIHTHTTDTERKSCCIQTKEDKKKKADSSSEDALVHAAAAFDKQFNLHNVLIFGVNFNFN